jgi:hypothetical protein
METLFDSRDGCPAAVVEISLESWRHPVAFAEFLYALAVLHNRLLSLRKYKAAITRGQLLHPAAYLADDERLAVAALPADGRPLEVLAYPAVARTLAAFLTEVAAAAPAEVPYKTLILLFKDELEILAKKRMKEEAIRRLLKLDALAPALAGARVALADGGD